jgi:23S rRNA pseudouridine1911/1915/1917 synthase
LIDCYMEGALHGCAGIISGAKAGQAFNCFIPKNRINSALSSKRFSRGNPLVAINTLNGGYEYRALLGVAAAGLRLVDYLTTFYPKFAREEWLYRIQSNGVFLDGIQARQDSILRPGQCLSWVRPPWVEPEVPRFFAILYRDEQVLGVAKPAGLPTNPGGGMFMENTLLFFVRKHFPGAIPLHRLGRGTSGIVLFAISKGCASRISQAWSRGEVLKVYRALAAGHPNAGEFEIDTPIGPVPHPFLGTIYAACPGGKQARSHVKTLELRADCSLVQVRITTGRSHQIRIHLAAAGHPLVGDPLFGVGGIPAADCRALPGDLGYHLHNALLGFPHPLTGKWTEIHCMPPPLLRMRSSALV